MGMQSLKTKIRKRKYKLSLNRKSENVGHTAITNATSEWEFEHFSPWACSTKPEERSDSECRIEIQPSRSPTPPPIPPRHGILSYFPRRPSSWTPNSAPPVPPHGWQARQQQPDANKYRQHLNLSTSANSLEPTQSPKLERSESQSSYRNSVQVPLTDSHVNERLVTCSEYRCPADHKSSLSNLKRVRSGFGSSQNFAEKNGYVYSTKLGLSNTHRCNSTSEVRDHRIHSNEFGPKLPQRKASLSRSGSQLSSSYTHLSELERRMNNSELKNVLDQTKRYHSAYYHDVDLDVPPAVPPHAPGVLCTRIDSLILGDKNASGSSSSNGRTFPEGTPDGARNRRSGTGSGSDSFGESDRRPGYTPPNDDDIDSTLSGTRKKAVSRSESLRERAQRKHHREKRKHSDPNLPPSHSSDVDLEGRSLSYNNSGSSSNSSLSTRSLESPSPLDMVSSTRVSGSALSDGSSGVSVALSAISSTSVGTGSGAGNGPLTPWDSDIEIDPDPPDWTRNLDSEVVEKMSPKEKQRQEVINELFHTERSHVRNLKVLERVFYRPLLENGLLPTDLVNLLFPNLPEMLEIHGRFNNMMKARKRDQPAVETVGDILLSMFDGSSGENFQQAAALFCRNQSAALETLKDRRKKDTKLQVFLNEAEGNPVCRRLQLKDIIPTAMQRLTKYPLLLESLAKYTTPRSEEAATVRKCLERSREILNKVNQAVKEAENYHRLVDIQRRLDKSAFEKADHPIANELRNFELTKHRLIYEGPLTWRTKGQKNVDLHVVLLEEYILLLQKQDDKYVLKFHSINYMGSKEESKFTHSPIIKIATVLVRPVATDKLALFLVNTSPSGAQIYDLVAVSIAERKAWFRHITDATEAYKTREGRNRRTDGSGGGPSPSGSHVPSLSASSSSAQLATTLESPEKIKDEEPTDDNISADSGVSLTPSSGETPPQNESSLNATDQQNQNLELIQAEAAKKAGETSSTPTSGSASPGGGSSAASPAPQRRLQRVEILKIAEGTPLIDPAEVVVSQGAVLTAEPVLTPLEKLRRKDQLIRTALAEKQRLVADMLHVPHSELESISESITETEGEKEARLLVVAAMTQASRLATVLNETLRLTEEEAIAAVSDPTPVLAAAAALSAGPSTSPRPSRRVNRMPGAPTTKLLNISAALNRDLTQLLGIVSQRDEERDQLRRELQKARDQITELLLLQATPSLSNSRPLSHASSSDNEAIASSEQIEMMHVLEESSSILAPNSESEANSRSETLVENPSSLETAESDVAQSAQCNQICDTSKEEVTEEDKTNPPCSADKSSILLDTSQSSEA